MAFEYQSDKATFSGRVSLALVIVLSLVIMICYGREDADGFFHGLQNSFHSFAAPIESVGMQAGSAFESAGDSLADSFASDETLTQLREEVARLNAEVSQLEEYRGEAQRLESLLDLKNSYALDGITARVIGRNTEAWNQTITLDVGENDGVDSGLTVMSASGVVGQIIATSATTATVRLLNDPQSGAAALIQSSREEGVVRGNLDGLLYLEDVDADAVVNVGDYVLTSGLGGSYTRGLLIGVVVKVDGALGDASRRIVVSSNDTVDSLEEVLVVMSTDGLTAYRASQQTFLYGASSSQSDAAAPSDNETQE